MGKDRKLRYLRIVIKLGTRLLTGGGEYLNPEVMSGLVSQAAALRSQGHELILVSSGAIASGRHRLGLARQRRVKGIPYKQVLAAVGQSRLMHLYDQLFSDYDITVAQALLARTDLLDRAGYLNARNTLLALLELGVVAIVNENDVVAVDEIKETRFGDNDNLSAMVANLVDADLLLILTDIDGLYSADPRCSPEACLIPEVARIGPEIEALAAGTTSSLATGGMITKIEAAKLATASGVTVIVAHGGEADMMLRAVRGEAVGTRFLPGGSKLESRQRWMLSGLCTRGSLIVDAGAAAALKQKRGSLLAAGIREVGGRFDQGDIVNIFDPDGVRLGCGISNYNSVDIKTIKGAHSGEITTLLGYDYGSEVVHRNNLVVI